MLNKHGEHQITAISNSKAELVHVTALQKEYGF